MRPSPLARFLVRLGTARRDGNNWVARCPSRRHRDPSKPLRVAEGRDARVVLYCPVGCTSREVLEALGLRMADLFMGPKRRTTARPRTADSNGDRATL